MANSITASTTSPFNSLLLLDANYQVSASFPTASGAITGSTPSVNFNNPNPYPTTANVIVQLFNSPLTGTSGSLGFSMSLQESSDNVTWNQIAIFPNTLLTVTDSAGSASAANTSVILGPNAKQYLRAWVSCPAGSQVAGTGISGTFGLNVLF